MVRLVGFRTRNTCKSLQENWRSFFKRLARGKFRLEHGIGEAWKELDRFRLQVAWNSRIVFTGVLVEEGARIPKPFGFSYYDFDRDLYVAHLLPLNLIVWLWHEKIRYFLKMPPRDKAMWDAFMAGYKKGMERTQHGSIQIVSGWTDKDPFDEYK